MTREAKIVMGLWFVAIAGIAISVAIVSGVP